MATEALPRFVEPMLASAGPLPDERDRRWVAEVKWDGMRGQVRVDADGGVCIRSRPGRECGDEFPELLAIGRALAGRAALIDGEIVCLGVDGRPDFARLRRRLTGGRPARAGRMAAQAAPAVFVAFDLLHLDGRSTRALPYDRRRELLESLELDGPSWTAPRLMDCTPAQLAEVTRERTLEGIVVKRRDLPYRSGRTRDWVKIKHRTERDYLVVAWTPGEADPDTLHLATRDGLQPAGSVQYGLGRSDRVELRSLLETLGPPSGKRRAGGRDRARRVSPLVQVTVAAGGPAAGPVRDAVLRGWRLDGDRPRPR